MAANNKQIDPNKYSKNKDITPESKRSVFYSVISMGLMLVGIIGIAMEMFRDDGWLKTLLHKLFQSTTNMSKSGDLPMYAMMAVGAYYLFKLVTTGSF